MIRKKQNQAKPFLPDDIIINILSRLSIKNAMQCRLVCKSWKDVTLDRDFGDLYCRNSIPPTIFVAKPYKSGLDLFSIDKWWEHARKRLVYNKFPFHSEILPNTSFALFSHAGLIVFGQLRINSSDDAIFTILNPTSPEKVRITFSNEFGRIEIYGVFFHPAVNEYCSLWNIGVPLGQPKQNNFKMLNLGSNPCLKTISNPCSHRFKWSGMYPVFMDNYLYWKLEPEQGLTGGHSGTDIMKFSIISEEFSVISCPAPLPLKSGLLNNNGTLCYVTIYPTKITIWRLEHPEMQLWSSAEYSFGIDILIEPFRRCRWYCKVGTPIAIVDGELGLLSDGKLVVCNLMEGTVKICQKRKYRDGVLFLSHHMSLASLRNCKPAIFIDQDGQVVI